MNHLKFRAVFILLLLSKQVMSQVLKLPSAGNFVKVGDLDVTGNQVTVEALIELHISEKWREWFQL